MPCGIIKIKRLSLHRKTGKPRRKASRSGARVAEEARLESVYTPKGYPEFESRSLRKIIIEYESSKQKACWIFCYFYNVDNTVLIATEEEVFDSKLFNKIESSCQIKKK